MPERVTARHAKRPMAALLLAALVVMLTLAAALPAGAQAAGNSLGAYGAPLRFVAPPGVAIEVDGKDRYADTIELRLATDGDLILINELSLEQYVYGLAEVPARWPEEALKAQAVAARTYAWWQTERGTYERRGRGYDICATTACQVFHGLEIVELPILGDRWKAAVDATAGEVLTFDGEPILARYSSTSGGATRNNETVFPSEGAYPYLKGVADPADAISPLHQWQVTFPLEDFNTILSGGQTLGVATPMASIELIPAVPGKTDQIRVTSQTGVSAEVSASQFRQFVSRQAKSLFPDRYPGQRSDGRNLPDVLPSSQMSFRIEDGVLVVDGRGWGHAVGMSQYGAYGQAEAGESYDTILRHYYTNVVGPAPTDRAPERIRVGLSSREGSGSFSVRADGPVEIYAGNQLITNRGLGTFTVSLRGDRSVELTAPEGYGAPLIASPTETSRTTPFGFEVITLETVINKPAEIVLEVVASDGTLMLRQFLTIADPGRFVAHYGLDDQDGDPLPPEQYEVTLVAVDENGDRVAESADVRVTTPRAGAPAETLLATRADQVDDGGLWMARAATIAAASFAGVGLGAAVDRRREDRRRATR